MIASAGIHSLETRSVIIERTMRKGSDTAHDSIPRSHTVSNATPDRDTSAAPDAKHKDPWAILHCVLSLLGTTVSGTLFAFPLPQPPRPRHVCKSNSDLAVPLLMIASPFPPNRTRLTYTVDQTSKGWEWCVCVCNGIADSM